MFLIIFKICWSVELRSDSKVLKCKSFPERGCDGSIRDHWESGRRSVPNERWSRRVRRRCVCFRDIWKVLVMGDSSTSAYMNDRALMGEARLV